jgi:quercetin dioxygenase-like cupin family protein
MQPSDATERFVLNPGPGASPSGVVFLLPQDIPWKKLAPDLGDRSPTVAILHVDPATQATTLMLRTPRNFHVPRHWHSHGEKHTVISGTFIFGCEGRRIPMGPGSFNYMPPRVVHEAWTPPDEDCLLFTQVEGPWDVNWVDAPPFQLKQS